MGTPDDTGWRQVALPGGGRLTVRPATRSDVDGVVALYEGLSDHDRYLRFFSCYSPPRSFFERLVTDVDRGGYRLVAVEGDRIVGEAGYELLPNGDGELGMTVAADARGWLGPYLLDALAEAAAARGVPNLEAQVLVVNRRMLSMLRSRGYATLPSDDWCALRLAVGTAGHTPIWPGDPAGAARPRVLVEVPGGRWHAAAEAEGVGLAVVACSGPYGPRPRCPVLDGRPCPLAAGADVVVMSRVPDDERWRAIADAHAQLHPGVPVCIEARHADPDRPGLTAGGHAGAVPLPAGAEPAEVADRVARLARRRSTGGPLA